MQALYRKYRPKKLDEVLGQETNIEILRNAAATGRLGQAYVFFGPRGTGKCVKYDTQIVEAGTGEIVTIEEAYRRKNISLLTLNQIYKLQPIQPNAYLDDGVKPCFEITTALGKTIEVTAVHPFLTIQGWKKLCELTIGEKIGLPRIIPIFGSFAMPEHQIKVLAYLISEGSTSDQRHHVISFTNSDPILADDFKLAAESFENIRVVKYDSKGTRTPTYRGVQIEQKNWLNKKDDSKNSIAAFVKTMGLLGHKSATKKIPPVIFQLNKKLLSLFLRTLFSGDGTIYLKSTPTIAYYSASKQLVHQVQHLLLRFGIISRIRRKPVMYHGSVREHWAVEITHRESLLTFKQEIGFVGARTHRLNELEPYLLAKTPNPNLDTIPASIYDLVYAAKEASGKTWSEAGVALGYQTPKRAMPRFLYSPSRLKLKIYGEVFESDEICNIATSDVYWDEIKSIRYTGDFRVYDLAIPQTHNFIANDFIVHNTTTARLLAKLLNCERRRDDPEFAKLGEPCNECRECLAIDAQNSFDVIEIDAASNRGIDEIRNLKEDIRTAPTSAAHKVYIIDEAHMLTGAAFNALLKTLEEPPAHAVIVLATTEYEKLPATITSRAQRFTFKKLSKATIMAKLKTMSAAEKIKIDDAALELIAAAGEGSFRDAESLLGQISSLAGAEITSGKKNISPAIDLATAERVTGRTGLRKVHELAELIVKKELKGALAHIAALEDEGHNLVQLTKDLIHYLRKVLSLKINPTLERTFEKDLTRDEIAAAIALGTAADVAFFIKIIKALIRAYAEMRYSPFAIVPLEIALAEQL